MNLEYLFSPTKQFTYPSGKLLDGGKIYVYFKDTENLATLYSPEDTFVSNPILLDANGRASVRADVAYQYRLEIYTNKDVLLYTCEAFCEGDGSGGFSFVIHDETLSGNGTAASPLGVINIPLAVNETMTAYEEIIDGQNALVLGVNSAWLDDKFDQELSSKVDRTEFEYCCSAMSAALDNKLDSSSFDLSNYYNKQETNTLLEQRVDREEFTQTINWVDQTKQDKLEFGYDENSAISSINNSALRGTGDTGSCPWISGGKEIADVQTLTSNMNFQVLSSFTLSGDHNHFISVKGGIYRFPNEWELASGINQTNTFLTQSAFNTYSNDISSNLSILYGQDSYLSGRIDNISGSLTSVYNTVNVNSGIWNDKLDTSAFTAYTAQADESYVLLPGTGIALSSDEALSTTTIWFTGTDGALSAGEGIAITSANGKQIITNNISAGDNISLVYDSESNKIRIDCDITGDVGHTYSGIAPILVDNVNDEISISGESLSAGPGIYLFQSGGYVVISAEDQSNCHCIKFTDTLTSVNLENYSAYDKVTVVNAQQYGTDCELHWDGNTKVFPSGLYCELVRGTKSDNSDKWSFMTSGWTNDNWWDYN